MTLGCDSRGRNDVRGRGLEHLQRRLRDAACGCQGTHDQHDRGRASHGLSAAAGARGPTRHGTREYVQVLRLLEDFPLDHVRGAIRDAVRLGAIGFDAVKHLVRCRLDHRPPHLHLAQYPHLPVPRVTTTAAADYLTLLGAGAE